MGAQISKLEQALGSPLPPGLGAFLRSWNGAELFQESIRLHGLDDTFGSLLQANRTQRPAGLHPTDLVFGDTAAGDLLVLTPQGQVHRLRGLEEDEGTPGWEERWLSGSSLEAWLAATVTRELPLYDSEGEFILEAFEEDGLALTPSFALKLARKALKKDSGAAELHHELGVAERRLGGWGRAMAAFARAAELDPKNPWIWFDLGRAQLQQGYAEVAASSFGEAATIARGHQAARYAVWQASALKAAGDEAGRLAACERARQGHPAIEAELQRAAAEAVSADDMEAYDAVAPLVDAFAAANVARRLPLAGAAPAKPANTAKAPPRTTPPQKRPRHPAPAPKRPRAKPPAAKSLSAKPKVKAKATFPRTSGRKQPRR